MANEKKRHFPALHPFLSVNYFLVFPSISANCKLSNLLKLWIAGSSAICSSKGFPHSRYELVTHFPRRNLSDLKGVTLEGADLHARDTVFIQLKN